MWVLVLLLNVWAAWIGGRQIEKRNSGAGAKAALSLSVAFQVLFLLYFKYLGFFAEALNTFLHVTVHVPTPGLPIGISFFRDIFTIDPRQFHGSLPEFIEEHGVNEVLFVNNAEVATYPDFAGLIRSLLPYFSAIF